MRILVVCQNYYPEPFRITDICEEWVKEGHDVTVVTGLPNYPMGKIYDGYKDKSKRNEVINGVKIRRCFEVGRRSGVLFRFLNYYSFAWSSKRYLKKLKDEFDVVFINQLSPVMMATGALAYKKKHGTKTVLYCLDLWPESLVVGGIKKGSVLYKHYHKVSKKIYKGVDRILVTSKKFSEYLATEFGIAKEKIEYLPQYAEDLFSMKTCKKEENETVDLMFAGNVGDAQSVETIIKTASITKDVENLRWHIVGDGSALENCKKLASVLNVDTVVFHGRKSLEEMPAYYQMADAMLVTLIDDPVLSLTLPGKVQTYMSAGKPILASANGEIVEVIKEAHCGFCVPAKDYIALSESVRAFCRLRKEGKISDLGKNGFDYYQKHFSKQRFFDGTVRFLGE